MGVVVRFPRHARASAGSSASKKSSRGTSPPVKSLKRLASFIEVPRSPLRMSDKCDSEHSPSAATFAWLISGCFSSQTAKGCDFVSMNATLLLAKFICQELLCWREMDIHSPSVDALLMAKVTRLKSDGTRLYIGEWCRALDIRPAKVAREAPINFGYLSGLISGKKTNPSRDMLEAVARVLDMKVGDLYSAPPSASLLDQVSEFDPQTIVKLSQKRRKRA
jgi:transcriptional regulator with XRE-family HTH domain